MRGLGLKSLSSAASADCVCIVLMAEIGSSRENMVLLLSTILPLEECFDINNRVLDAD